MGTLIPEDESGDSIGIGINFYDDNGGSHRFSFQAGVTSDAARPLSPVLEDISNDPTLTPTPKKDVIGQIDDLLTRVYSEQGQSLDRSARKASVTSTTHSNRSGPRSRDSSRNFSPVGSNSLAYTTPSRQPLRGETFASIQRSQSLYSPSTLYREAHSPKTTFRISSATPLEPYRLTSGDNRIQQTTGSGFSPSESSPSLSYVTYGHRIPGAPNSSPTIVKRSNRNIPSVHQVSTNQQRLSLYFNEEELHLAYLKVEALRENLHCPGHEFCNTCIDTEYARIFTVMMATTFPPEDRATIIKHNRSLRTIKNVSKVDFTFAGVANIA
jgi:LAS seventeen-binding protein 1/2